MFTKIKKIIIGKKTAKEKTYLKFILPMKLLSSKIKIKLDKTNPKNWNIREYPNNIIIVTETFNSICFENIGQSLEC